MEGHNAVAAVESFSRAGEALETWRGTKLAASAGCTLVAVSGLHKRLGDGALERRRDKHARAEDVARLQHRRLLRRQPRATPRLDVSCGVKPRTAFIRRKLFAAAGGKQQQPGSSQAARSSSQQQLAAAGNNK